jgi:hypothetical protein
MPVHLLSRQPWTVWTTGLYRYIDTRNLLEQTNDKLCWTDQWNRRLRGRRRRWWWWSSFFSHGATASIGPGPPHYRGLTITLRHTTLGRTPLNELSARPTWQHTTLTRDRHPCPGGIRTHNLSKRLIADQSLRPLFDPQRRVVIQSPNTEPNLITWMWKNYACVRSAVRRVSEAHISPSIKQIVFSRDIDCLPRLF